MKNKFRSKKDNQSTRKGKHIQQARTIAMLDDDA